MMSRKRKRSYEGEWLGKMKGLQERKKRESESERGIGG